MSASPSSPRPNQIKTRSEHLRIVARALVIGISAAVALSLSVIAFALQP
ncbi:hypothetical protein [Herbiconiux sp. UC225_62]